MEKKYTYSAQGVVYGQYWGGGEGTYAAKKYSEPTIEELRAKIEKDVASGSIDSGMGYQKVLGAVMEITTTTTVEIDGKPFTNEETEIETFGDLTDEQYDFTETQLFGF